MLKKFPITIFFWQASLANHSQMLEIEKEFMMTMVEVHYLKNVNEY
ncbi:hypothetical protein HMPREF9141_2439 [Prevotella multiformis DSM 16608]|uniref:Uncharacterized protein n=1 Tax=Prevotella multiformis DSM 16608 TaxID=888743 RepID=F0FA22_9BACT|nr:hypothetical protein HMPREF9141_2439 [Prevotella multiformis DSM 16608]